MKKKMIGFSAVVLLGVLAAAGCGHRGGCHPFGGPGHFAEKRIRQLEQELKMTDTQKAQFRELRGRLKGDIITDFGEKRKLMDTVNERLKADNPGIDEIVTLARAQMRKSHARMEEKLSYITEFYNILNPEQKRILVQKVREHLADKEKMTDKLLEHLGEFDK